MDVNQFVSRIALCVYGGHPLFERILSALSDEINDSNGTLSTINRSFTNLTGHFPLQHCPQLVTFSLANKIGKLKISAAMRTLKTRLEVPPN